MWLIATARFVRWQAHVPELSGRMRAHLMFVRCGPRTGAFWSNARAPYVCSLWSRLWLFLVAS